MHEIDRTERMQRIRVGLTGLAVVFLIVLLATIIYSYVDRGSSAHDVSNPNQTAEEPLSDLGVVPSAPDNQSAPANSTAP
jgi:hypothetical protein